MVPNIFPPFDFSKIDRNGGGLKMFARKRGGREGGEGKAKWGGLSRNGWVAILY